MTRPARIRAAFYRGGTSKAVVFRGEDLPSDTALWEPIFLHALGSPDAYGRQLNGMGGGLSSLSKVVIVSPSARDDADVDYTFVQVAVDKPVADYGSACGNMSSAVGPFAVEEDMVEVNDGTAIVRIYNTNTDQIYRAEFQVQDGIAVEAGTFEIPGVTPTGAPVKLDFMDPGGSKTEGVLPSGAVVNQLDIPELGMVEVSLVDAANPVVFVNAERFGKTGAEAPSDLDADKALMTQPDLVRRHGAVKMGMASTPEAAALSNPKVAMVAAPTQFVALDGRVYDANSYDVSVRLISMGNFHRAVTLTGAMCVAVASRIDGTLVSKIAKPDEALRIGNASGVLPVDADVDPNGPTARSATTFRTQRRIMEGQVLVPFELMEGTD